MAFMINGAVFKYPDGLKMKRTDNIVNTFTTLAGGIVGDISGWKYADNTLTWSYLTAEQINTMITATANQFAVTFDDLDGTEHTVNAIRTSTSYNKMFRFIAGQPCFTDIMIGVKYPDVYDNN